MNATYQHKLNIGQNTYHNICEEWLPLVVRGVRLLLDVSSKMMPLHFTNLTNEKMLLENKF